MVEITNGESTLTVTKGAYNQLFKNSGWELTGNSHNSSPRRSEPKINPFTGLPEGAEPDSSEDEEDDEEEIPLSEMSMEQLREYAEENEIDLQGVRSKSDAREIIRQALEEE